ncbi:MAG: MotA/TolQ/ExbB proton channel family protein [Planctomycetota bacterium]
MDITQWTLMDWVNNSVYGFQAIVALWGLYCAIVVWKRSGETRFKTMDEQMSFLELLGQPVTKGDFKAATEMCEGDPRAVCQLAILSMANFKMGFAKAKQLALDTFQREVLSDIEFRLTGVNMAIKTEPMLGLLGTVMGMMQAFGKLAGQEGVKPEQLASDISFALITTAVGLAVSIPYMFILSKLNVRIRKMEENITMGLGRFFDLFKAGLDGLTRRAG